MTSSSTTHGAALVMSLDMAARAGKREVGGKAANLVRLGEHGSVPPWICVTTAAFAAVLSRVDPADFHSLQVLPGTRLQDVSACALRIQSAIRTIGFSQAEEEAILAAFDTHFPVDARIAVRSSSVSEDSDQNSFAGQFESYLNVRRSALLQRILDCFASAFSPHCLLYRSTRSAESTLGTAVILQLMVPATISGVLFTRSPMSAKSPRMVVSASYGLGEGVVQDQVEADTFVIDWADGRILEREIKAKSRRVSMSDAASQGTTLDAVPRHLQQAPALSDSQLAALHTVGRRLEAAFRKPQDVEWAFDQSGTLHLLQARPITTAASPRAVKVFDCSNISENYQGATTALTFSYVRRYYEEIFRSAAATFGMSSTRLARERQVFAYLVSYLGGGAYYNLANWYRMFYAVPGFRHFVASFEHGVGLGRTPAELEDLKADCARDGGRNTNLLTYLRIARIYLSLDRMFAAHRAMFECYRARFEQVKLQDLEVDALLALFDDMQQDLGKKWGTPLVNDYFAFNCFMLLENVVKRWGIDPAGGLLGDLMRGEQEPVSVEPIRALREVAMLADEVPVLAQALRGGGPGVQEALVRPEAAAFRHALATYMKRYGDRRFDELKFEAPTLAERPEVVWSLLRNFLGTGGDRVDEAATRQKRRSSDSARARALATLSGHPIRRLLFGILLAATHKCLVHREYGRLVRSQRCGMERAILMELGRRFADKGAIRRREDIVHLSLEEIEACVQGAGVTSSLERLIDLRRSEYETNQVRSQPLRIVTGDLPQASAGFESQPRASSGTVRSSLKGTGCSPGRVRGRARVVTTPSSILLERGDILIAHATDPAWAFLMATAAGLVVERGNLLSHAAIIGRELGIPCVIGIADAMRSIPDGQVILVDGATGEVFVEEHPHHAATTSRPVLRKEEPIE